MNVINSITKIKKNDSPHIDDNNLPVSLVHIASWTNAVCAADAILTTRDLLLK